MGRLVCCLLVLTTLACTRAAGGSAQLQGDSPSAPRRVILFIGDGVGIAYWSAAYLAGDSLAVAGFPVVGLVAPGNTSHEEPESASGATAFALGERTHSEGVGVGADSLPRTSVLEAAEAAGLSTGLVTTTFLVDATPAAFAAHVAHRHDFARIAPQMAAAGIEVLLGDGRRYFAGKFEGGRDLMPGLRARYRVVEDPAELAGAADSATSLLGLFDMDGNRDPATREPRLAAMTAAALAVLDRDPEGFFLLVENEHTDHSGHENLPLSTVRAEVMELDRAVREALTYRARNPETLIVVAADHETGGLSLVPDSAGALTARYGTTDHSAELVPIFALGPGAEAFGGVQTNAAIGRHLRRWITAD